MCMCIHVRVCIDRLVLSTGFLKSSQVGKPDLPPSWSGGGWGGPRDGHDKDMRYMLRGEAA